jgi:3-oxoacyl-[acyl-carrier protein] reductase
MKPVAFVTGGSRGIGFGIARRLAELGFDLAINGMRPEDAVAEPVAALRALGAEVLYCPGDIGQAAARAAMVERICAHYGRLNWLVNNAGVAPKQRLDLLEMTEESFHYVVNTNLAGAFFLSQTVARWLIEQKEADLQFSGGIVNVSSISATVVSINRGEYCMAKAGLSMATQLLAVRLGPWHLPVFEVRPGVTRTDMTAGVTEKYDKLIADGLCVTPRWGLPEDVGNAVGALVGSGFGYSTGQVIMVDGGLTIPRL